MKNILIFSCSGMFRNVSECSGMFLSPGFIDAHLVHVYWNKTNANMECEYQQGAVFLRTESLLDFSTTPPPE